MRVLFVSRAFPPTIGGIEKQNAEVAEFLGKKTELTLIANRKGKSFLPLFLPWALLNMFVRALRTDVILLGDGVLAPLAACTKVLFPRVKVVSIIHGLDLTFAKKSGSMAKIYTNVNLPSLRKLDAVICVSEDTKQTALSVGIDESKAFVIPNGIDPDFFDGSYKREELAAFLERDLTQTKVMLRLGRFVKHKGVEWFIRNVMPKLPENIILVAAGGVAKSAHPGDHNIFPLCEQAVKELGLEKRVILYPNLAWDKVKLLLDTADIAISPNIPVPGSMEGFGISVLEASLNRLPIVVSKLEGLQEAVADWRNGIFAEPENAEDYVTKITWLLEDETRRKAFGEQARTFTIERFHWDTISNRYLETLEKIKRV